MLAPYCETESAEPIVEKLGLVGLSQWKEAYPGVVANGSLVLAAPRDQRELQRFGRMTRGHRMLERAELDELEPDLGGRFERGLYYPEEAHLAPRPTLEHLAAEVRRLGGKVELGTPVPEPLWQASSDGGPVIDCRGIAAKASLSGLRGVRGEMAVVRAPDVRLARPIRLLHPRFPIYVVPWGGGEYMIGATMIEREDTSPVTVRSSLELLSTACAVHPAFGEAEIIELSAGVRPAFPDNLPRVINAGRRIAVNGAYRHGFLLAPVLAGAVCDLIEKGRSDHPLIAPR
jgi:glycine oxidase